MPEFHVDRRSFLALTAGAAFGSLALPQALQASEPRVLVTVLDRDPPTMNNAISTDIQCTVACSPAYNYLLRLDPEGKPSPDLAEEWTVSEDGTTYTFRLRTGVTFHDGAPFTAADVKFTMEEMLAKHHPMGRNAYIHLDAITTPDDHTVIVKFTQPNQPYLAVPSAWGPILPKHIWEGTDFTQNKADKAPIGTGPFKFAEYTIGESLRFVKNEAYFIPGQPVYDELLIRIIPDAVSRSAAFENGDLDTIPGNSLPAADLARLAALPGTVVKKTAYSGTAWMAFFNLRSPITGNKMVRKALAHAIDRGFIRETTLPGTGHAMVGPLWPSSPLYNTALTDYALDIAKANALLDEAGLPRSADGSRFEMRLVWQSGNTMVGRMADIIVENLKEVGVKVKLMPNETAVVMQNAHIDGEFEMLINTYALGPDPDYGTERLYNSANIRPVAHTNNSHYANPEVDALFAAQRLAPNFAARKEIYDKIQEIIWDDLPMMAVSAYDLLFYYNTNLIGGDLFSKWNGFVEDYSRAEPV